MRSSIYPMPHRIQRQQYNDAAASTIYMERYTDYTVADAIADPLKRWVDVILSIDGKDQHTVRIWRTGALTIQHCTGGSLAAQDTMYAISGKVPCPSCMGFIATLRLHSMNHYALAYYRSLLRALNETGILRTFLEKAKARKQYHATSRHMETFWEHDAYSTLNVVPMLRRAHAEVRGLAPDALYAANHEWAKVHIFVYIGALCVQGKCEKRPYRKSDKSISLWLPTSWLLLHKRKLTVLDGHFIGQIERETPTELEAWVLREMSPFKNTHFHKALFTRNAAEGAWAFKHWRRGEGVTR